MTQTEAYKILQMKRRLQNLAPVTSQVSGPGAYRWQGIPSQPLSMAGKTYDPQDPAYLLIQRLILQQNYGR